MKIEIHEKVSQQPNGDRDTQRHPSSSFKVVLINGDKTSVLFECDQFDPWWTHINGTRKEFLNKAQGKALELAKTIGCEAEIEPNLAPDRISELQERIARDQAELDQLRNDA